jgi:hypothetical protein
MSGAAPQDPTRFTAPASPKRGMEPESAPTDETQLGTSDEGALLEDDDYLLERPRRYNRLTVALVVALIFLCGFIVGVLAARLTSGLPRGSAESGIVSTVGPAPVAVHL